MAGWALVRPCPSRDRLWYLWILHLYPGTIDALIETPASCAAKARNTARTREGHEDRLYRPADVRESLLRQLAGAAPRRRSLLPCRHNAIHDRLSTPLGEAATAARRGCPHGRSGPVHPVLHALPKANGRTAPAPSLRGHVRPRSARPAGRPPRLRVRRPE